MIRRTVGDEYWLITQDDHARLAAGLAGHFGNGEFESIRGEKPALLGVAMHDCGWPLHDDLPTLNGRGEPLDVFEVSREIALKVWGASADWAEAADSYAGLLTSLHVLSLSEFATSQIPSPREKFDINKFQQREIERQEGLRTKLGMRTDLPLKYGLAASGIDEREDRLAFDFRMLQAMDLVSLAMSCTVPPVARSKEVWTRPGGGKINLEFSRRDAWTTVVKPWPFDCGKMEFEVPFRRIARRKFEDVEAFRAAYAGAAVESMELKLEK